METSLEDHDFQIRPDFMGTDLNCDHISKNVNIQYYGVFTTLGIMKRIET